MESAKIPQFSLRFAGPHRSRVSDLGDSSDTPPPPRSSHFIPVDPNGTQYLGLRPTLTTTYIFGLENFLIVKEQRHVSP